jgi:hypothetical protein
MGNFAMPVVRVKSGKHHDPSPPVLPDDRFGIRFAACGIITLVVVSVGCFAIALDWVPAALESAAFWACIGAGLLGVAAALSPLLFGIRCRACTRRIFSAKSRPPYNRRSPIRFYCPACKVEWDTGFWWGEE